MYGFIRDVGLPRLTVRFLGWAEAQDQELDFGVVDHGLGFRVEGSGFRV